MSPLVTLITAWEEFAANNPKNATAEEFCRDFLDNPNPKRRSNRKPAFDLARRIGRLASIQRTCLRLAFQEIPDMEPEWYYFLYSINKKRRSAKQMS